MTDIWTNAPEWTPPAPPHAGGGGAKDIWEGAPEWKSDATYKEIKIPPSATIASVARQLPIGFNESLADVGGAPVDATTWVMNHLAKVAGLGEPIQSPVGGSESLKTGLGFIGADPRATPAQNVPEAIARGVGGGVGMMLGPEAIWSALQKAGALTPQIVKTFERYFGKSSVPSDVAKNVVVGAGAGGGGEAAAEVVPEEYKPATRALGSVIGGGMGLGAIGATEAVPAAVRGAAKYVQPMTKAGQETLAGETLQKAAKSPSDVRDALADQPPDLVPGSQPTTFQVTGDVGLGSLEREVQTANPAEFAQRRAEQNQARVQAIQNLQPTGNPMAIAGAVRSELANIDTMTHNAVDRYTQFAQMEREQLGGMGTPEQYGAALRTAVQDAENNARVRERRLWNAIDPDGTLTVPTNPVSGVSRNIYGNLSAAAQAGLSPAERSLTEVIGNYRGVEPFRELADLRSATSAAVRNELRTAGRTPAYARLSQLRSGIEDALSGVVEQRAGQEGEAVSRGQLNPDQTMLANYRRVVDEWFRQRAGQGAGEGIANVPSTARPAAVPPASGGQGQGGIGFRDVTSDQGIPPTFDRDAQARLAQATAATRQRVATYGRPSGPVGEVLRSAGERGQYQVPTSGVGAKIFVAGPRGFENVSAYRAATSDPEALNTLQDYVASRLQQAASRPDGTLDPTKTENWLRAHAEAMRAFPELGARFQDAASATSAIEDVAALRKYSMDSMQKGELSKLIGAKDDADVVKIIGNSLKSPQAMAQIRANATTPEAREGLRKAVIDHVYNKFVSNTEVATSEIGGIKSDQFQTFMRQNRPALRAAGFSDEEVSTMTAIAADLNRANRSLNAIKIPGQSNTAQDLVKKFARQQKTDGGHFSLFTQFFVAASEGFEHGGLLGAVGGIAAIGSKETFNHLVGGMRAAGMEQVGDLVKAAMLNPELAHRLLAKVPPEAAPRAAISIGQLLRRISAVAPQQQFEVQPAGAQ